MYKIWTALCYRKNDVIFRRCGPDDDVINCIDNVTAMTLSTQNQFLLKNAGEHQPARKYGVPTTFGILVTLGKAFLLSLV